MFFICSNYLINFFLFSYSYRFWNVKSAVSTNQYLKGLKEGRRISDKHWKEKFEREKLTDDQIIAKAKDIESGRRYRGEK